MNLKAYFAAFFITVGLFSCSEDRVIDENPEPEIVYDATLSLVLKHDTTSVKTKANTNLNQHYNFVKKISVAVFQRDKLVSFKEASSNSGVYQLDEIKVPAGAVKLVVLANTNVGEDLQKTSKTDITSYENMLCTLDNEINGSLSMSSGFLAFDLVAGHNYIGYGDAPGNISVSHSGTSVNGVELKGAPIQLTHNVANILFYNLKLRPVKPEYIGKGDVKFTLKEMFLTDAKSYSKSIWVKSNGINSTVEVKPNDPNLPQSVDQFWWSGDAIGSFPEDASQKNFFKYDYINYPKDMEAFNKLYYFVNGIWDVPFKEHIPGSEEKKTISNSPAEQFGYGGGLPFGVDFYTYENTDESRPTALVLKGDYSYCPNVAGEYETIEDTYYTIVINSEGKSSVFDRDGNIIGETGVSKYIHQNNRYIIYAVIVGPGSNKPSEAHISAAVEVKNWDVVNQEEEVD
ncbi:MAG: fimbrial protein [Parabacteroides gordonii]|uniref:fimbrial protein n=1 Tax=Parabacteroides gordonii TaxID=574930 RepID=UPI003A84F17E